MSLGKIELFLIEVIIFTLIYIGNRYVGFLVCLVIGCIAIALLLLSFFFEIIDRSKVPKSYYLFMLNTAIAAFLVLFAFSTLLEGSFDWMSE